MIFKRRESPFVFIELFTYSPKLSGSIIFFVYTPVGADIVCIKVDLPKGKAGWPN